MTDHTKQHRRMRRLLDATGAETSQNRFVERPGVLLHSKTGNTPQGDMLNEKVNLDLDRPEYEQRAQLGAQTTFLSFSDDDDPDAEEFNRKMVEDFGHMSVHTPTYVTFVIAGVSVETSQEIVAHDEIHVSRLTSSRTKAQDDPWFRIQGDDEEERRLQKQMVLDAVERVSEFRESFDGDLSKDDRERINRMFPACKANALVATCSIKEWHSILIGRLSHHGVEQGMRIVCEEICEQLHERYPLVVKEPEWYYDQGNDEKYEIE